MIWLQSNEAFDKVATFDPETGTLEEVSRRQLGGRTPDTWHGFYSQLEGMFLALYGLAGRLFLVVNKEIIEIAPDQVIQVSGPRRERHLRIVCGAETVREFTYNIDSIAQLLPGDPTPFVEDEDFDIGLFASNISMNPERRNLFLAKKELGSALDR
jgi:hypothetical protein